MVALARYSCVCSCMTGSMCECRVMFGEVECVLSSVFLVWVVGLLVVFFCRLLMVHIFSIPCLRCV